MLALYALGIVGVLELALYLPPLWSQRKYYSVFVLLVLTAALSTLVMSTTTVVSGLLAFIGAYRLFNLIRVNQGRLPVQPLYHMAFRTSLVLILLQGVVIVAWYLTNLADIEFWSWMLITAIFQVVFGLMLFASTRRHLRTTMPMVNQEHFSDHELPSISVCIPARNETDTLEDSLRTLLTSDYPKLEILVLDDCSQDKTSEIIRSFAHDGVRFVKGEPPPDNWLAKNWAYQQLYRQANGELLIFAGVDVRFEPHALRAFVTDLLTKKKSMLCIIPRNIVPSGLAKQRVVLLQPLRYAWELCLPRRMFNRPPVLSSCWAIQRTLIESAGSFAAVSNSVSPESYFAKVAIKHDGYSFVQSSSELAVTSLKNLGDQWNTAVRTRYPQLHKRPEMVMFMTLSEFLCLIGPLALGVWGSIAHQWLIVTLSLLATILITTAYVWVVQLTYRKFFIRSLIALPFAAALDIYIRHESMGRYEFSEVLWKGRNICMPVMHVTPHLPKV